MNGIPRGRDAAVPRLGAGLFAAASIVAGAMAPAASNVPILDPGFGGADGIARIAFDVIANGHDAAATAVLADGKLVLVGTAQVDASRYDLAFVRLDASGTPDPGFGSSGRVLAGLAPVYLSANVDRARKSDGRLLYVARTTASGATTVVGRRNADGSADTSFNGSGHRFFSAGFFDDGATTVELARVLPLADDKTLAIGFAGSEVPLQVCLAVARLNAGSTPDSGFGSGQGRVCPAPELSGGAGIAYAFDGVVLDDGRILLAGGAMHPGGSGLDMSVARLLPDGQLDVGFGPAQDGWDFVGFDQGGNLADLALAMAVDRDGRIVIVGGVEVQAGYDIGVARLLPSGGADPSFGMDGRVQLGLISAGINPYAFSAHALADGRILVASQSYDNGTGLVAMLTADGQLDPHFGEGGLFRQAAADAPSATVVALGQVLADGDHLHMVGANAPTDAGDANRDFAATRYVLPLFRNGFE